MHKKYIIYNKKSCLNRELCKSKFLFKILLKILFNLFRILKVLNKEFVMDYYYKTELDVKNCNTYILSRKGTFILKYVHSLQK